jgi:hypothetical protein
MPIELQGRCQMIRTPASYREAWVSNFVSYTESPDMYVWGFILSSQEYVGAVVNELLWRPYLILPNS